MISVYIISAGLSLITVYGAAIEAALLGFRRSRLEELLAESPKPPLAGDFLRKLIRENNGTPLAASLFATVVLGVNLMYLRFFLAAPFIEDSARHTKIIALAVMLLLVTLLRAIGVIAGRNEPEEVILKSGIMLPLSVRMMSPLAWLLRKIATVIARSLGRKTDMSEEERLEEKEDEVIAALSDGELDGVVEEHQREMIEGIFDLRGTDVADVFTPRTEMVSIEANLSLSEAIGKALENGFSRMPVHEETRDNMIGIFYVRDALKFWGEPEDKIPALRDILRKPIYVPETKDVQELLREMREEQTHMAIVLDEYGGTAGLVTIEDVLEEIVGEIHDEYDTDDMSEQISHIDENTIIADAATHVHDINEALDTDIIPEDDDYETIAGFVLDNLGHIPEAGEDLAYKSLAIKVLEADDRRIIKVQIIRDRNLEDD